MKSWNWNKPKHLFSIAELEQKYKVRKNKIHTNQVWIYFLRDACLAFIFGLILSLAFGLEKIVFGEFHIFFKILILFPFAISFCQFFFSQRLVFYDNKILIKRPFKKAAFIAYSDINFASILEERNGSSSMTNREVLIIVINDSGLDWNVNLANTKEFKGAVKRNNAINYTLNKTILIDFLLHYKKNFYNAENFISNRYRINFTPIQDLLVGEDISLTKANEANSRAKNKKKLKREMEYREASLQRKKEMDVENKYIELLEREVQSDENGNIIGYSNEEKKFLNEYKKNERKKLYIILGISAVIIFFMFILPIILA